MTARVAVTRQISYLMACVEYRLLCFTYGRPETPIVDVVPETKVALMASHVTGLGEAAWGQCQTLLLTV